MSKNGSDWELEAIRASLHNDARQGDPDIYHRAIKAWGILYDDYISENDTMSRSDELDAIGEVLFRIENHTITTVEDAWSKVIGFDANIHFNHAKAVVHEWGIMIMSRDTAVVSVNSWTWFNFVPVADSKELYEAVDLTQQYIAYEKQRRKMK